MCFKRCMMFFSVRNNLSLSHDYSFWKLFQPVLKRCWDVVIDIIKNYNSFLLRLIISHLMTAALLSCIFCYSSILIYFFQRNCKFLFCIKLRATIKVCQNMRDLWYQKITNVNKQRTVWWTFESFITVSTTIKV